MRQLSLALLLVFAAACSDEGVRAINRSTGQISTFSSTETVPAGWDVCPQDQTCPEPFPCEGLPEADCLARVDCEAVYEACSSGTPVFQSCKTKPTTVCAGEGESCTTNPCCPGHECCAGVPVPPGAEYCAPSTQSCPISDRNQKHAIVAVDTDAVLEKLGKLQLATWSYNFERGVRHMGPMAQDFAATFELGATDKRIFTVDADGVALASIQALLKRVETLQGENQTLDRENDDLRKRLDTLEKRFARLERAAR